MTLGFKLENIQMDSKEYDLRHVLVFLSFIVLVPFFIGQPAINIDNPFRAKTNENIDAQLWLKKNTSKNSLILTPPYMQDFRIFSERSTLGSYKDWTYNCLERDFAFTMYERLHDTGNISWNDRAKNRPDIIKKYYMNLKEDDLIKIARKYKIDYIVMEKGNALGLEKVYENNQYIIMLPLKEHKN